MRVLVGLRVLSSVIGARIDAVHGAAQPASLAYQTDLSDTGDINVLVPPVSGFIPYR